MFKTLRSHWSSLNNMLQISSVHLQLTMLRMQNFVEASSRRMIQLGLFVELTLTFLLTMLNLFKPLTGLSRWEHGNLETCLMAMSFCFCLMCHEEHGCDHPKESTVKLVMFKPKQVLLENGGLGQASVKSGEKKIRPVVSRVAGCRLQVGKDKTWQISKKV